ncbi:MAG: hypothetical protein A2845_01165 [Candidatus Lloydbacteria bacterium RIFCSPHIGHO2_01_FULL_49_22]|uniref:Uncharacterized protein n=1 Tax=Candidatus Lloydbacteria bacterium RIFCSPHIGHO2_01_FULL_49_22 TaxID=1798658 RepID=A0A1G2CYM1_9BACT|nr:MAG: hypothetical protein A2845_01165 [Candidatus Lloydbacteria bacterium RIFCSPHIGHO2_01_FULL_49_22]OGZ09233.1 MAG: hypothetical protein A3C14_06170 [Candidatus Lloydbacteria bacterium RIFCSPHIGHO2_02_FULL_50_18]
MTRKKNPPKPVQKWWATIFVFFAPEATDEFLTIALPSFRANTEADAIVQATQHITRNWFNVDTESYRMDDDEKTMLLPWKLVTIEIPELFAKHLEEAWQFDKREERREAKMPTSQDVTIIDFPIRPPVDGGTPPSGQPDKPKK